METIEIRSKRERRQPFYLFLLALLINATALILSHNYLDGDTHTRTYMALQWLEQPFFISHPNDITWVFGPLHCYLNALALWVWNDPTLSPRLLSLLLTSLTIFPLYHSVRLAFGSREAFYSTLLFCFYTLFIHPAAIAASEGINLLLVFLSIWCFLRWRESKNWGDLLLAAMSVMLATSMRYESWLLAPFFGLLIVWPLRRGLLPGAGSNLTRQWSQFLSFTLISHGFILLWTIACWIKWGDPLYFTHYSGNLDAPTIAKRLEEAGALKIIAYNLAFLPVVMALSSPVTTLLVAAVGFVRALRHNLRNIFVLLFGIYLVFHLVVFVFSFERYPLARFMTIPAALFLAFTGAGIVALSARLMKKAARALTIILVVCAVVNVIGLSFFSQPSDNGIAEKLRAVSPLTNPPDYFLETASFCTNALVDNPAAQLVVDHRNFNDRLLYLDLYGHRRQIHVAWSSNEQLARFIKSQQPRYVLHTRYPRNNHELFELTSDGRRALIAEQPYHRLFTSGIFTVYELVE